MLAGSGTSLPVSVAPVEPSVPVSVVPVSVVPESVVPVSIVPVSVVLVSVAPVSVVPVSVVPVSVPPAKSTEKAVIFDLALIVQPEPGRLKVRRIDEGIVPDASRLNVQV